ncbi:glycoside hydrolase family 88 protein [Novosphingobium sp.]|uniref:glycoside hydrolase family 88/105 protein n=1 Tax=Novosphingobium sp. TaxID=1874826 RepID=UPI00261CDCAC|nr:glycoside hydrolase family 88 protein [Novosphingobium sp.]
MRSFSWIAALAMVASSSHAEPALQRAVVLAQAEKAADWQLSHLTDLSGIRKVARDTRDVRGWQQATFYVALTQLADRSSKPRYRDAVLELGRATGWRLGDRPFHADDHLVGSPFIWAARNGGGRQALAGVVAGLDFVVRHPSPAGLALSDNPADPDPDDRWSWADALFMAPPTYFELTRATGDARYASFADHEFKATTAFLLDPAESLYFRDSRFLTLRDSAGRKILWARGNGWVLAGIARILEALPAKDPRRLYYENLLRSMAARLKQLQRPDGFWSPSLLADASVSPPESSGTGFVVYGMAYGVKAGILARPDYEPVIRSGWLALNVAMSREGKVGWVQQVGDRPDNVLATDTQFYGSAAFIMAACAVSDLDWR